MYGFAEDHVVNSHHKLKDNYTSTGTSKSVRYPNHQPPVHVPRGKSLNHRVEGTAERVHSVRNS